jgi:drug/metabolite transporter (DMT)-like permease
MIAAPIFALILRLWTDWGSSVKQIRLAWRSLVVVTVANTLLPFWLMAWGQERVEAGVAAIASASTPVFVAALAPLMYRDETSDGMQRLGIVLGLIGVGILVGFNPSGSATEMIGTAAVVLSAALYGFAYLYIQAHLAQCAALVITGATTIIGALFCVPLILTTWPPSLPGLVSMMAVVVIAICFTGLATFLLFKMIERYGATRSSLVTYLTPPFALFLAALVLNERPTTASILGLGVILTAVALGSGAFDHSRRDVS